MPTFAIKASRLPGSEQVELTVWEPTSYTGPHSTLSTLGLGEGAWGLLTTRRSDRLEQLEPGSDDRIVGYAGWWAALQAKAVRILTEVVGEVGEVAPGRRWTTVSELEEAGWRRLLDREAVVVSFG